MRAVTHAEDPGAAARYFSEARGPHPRARYQSWCRTCRIPTPPSGLEDGECAACVEARDLTNLEDE